MFSGTVVISGRFVIRLNGTSPGRQCPGDAPSCCRAGSYLYFSSCSAVRAASTSASK